MFNLLKKEGVKKETIEKHLYLLSLKKIDELKKIFDEDYICEDSDKHIKNLKIYINLKGLNNKVWKADEINNFCLKRGISLEIFIQEILLNGGMHEEISSHLINKVKKGKSLFIGKEMKISEKCLKKYAKNFIKLCEKITGKFCNTLQIHYSRDIKMEAFRIIIERCGNLVYNLSDNSNALYGAIFNKVYKSLYSTFKYKNEISLTKADGYQSDIKYVDENFDKFENNESNLKDNYQYLSKEEIEVIRCFETVLEFGDKIPNYSEIAKRLNKTEDELNRLIIGIRKKIVMENDFER